MRDLIIHVGMHKTGTTWLQKEFFPKHPDCYPLVDSVEPWNDLLLRYLVLTRDEAFDPDMARALLADKVRSVGVPAEGIGIISAERLSGHPLSGGVDGSRIASRLYQSFPDAKVLIMLRRQTEMLQSVYTQIVSEGFLGSPRSLFATPWWKSPFLTLDYFKYDLLIGTYVRLFGRGQVLAFPFEVFSKDPLGFSGTLQDAGGMVRMELSLNSSPRNASWSYTSYLAFRVFNRFRKTEFNRFPLISLRDSIVLKLIAACGRLTGRKVRVDLELLISSSEIAELEASNQRLSNLLGDPIYQGWKL